VTFSLKADSVLKIQVLWDVTSGWVVNSCLCFKGTHCLRQNQLVHVQGFFDSEDEDVLHGYVSKYLVSTA